MRRVLTCLLSNNPGVLNRFTGTLTRRQVNIDSISISPVGDKSASRVTAVIYLDDTAAAKQLVAQLNKQIDVLEIHDITEQPHIERELALIRVNAATNKRAELFAMVQPFRADVVDVALDSLMIQITGSREKVNALLRVVQPYGVTQVVRTGVAGFTRAEG
ncbi:acetolactate synthase small subunit [Loigolactobacillus coryniformis]|jgi:acetolactate synthase-1/3 small subunit|uniref:Acetolactate synthase small subunit n=3 Tax=Loigolactobacillus coryniformis TaxID=1610 RepID=J3JAW2_9LACO|nr:acetolactate synthase small subunit [Loigolactobacillus coryniformis]OEH90403.1 acetolactate synthase small subunit [Loigolactobacillus coryniformis subsp. coryniformis]RRG05076.1 MAG: acetolactate synthase small subunit [Lactobacillus sp.]ATO44861.1 acetolactate synthase small subunit [Loigolactobacillus coryniformis subsp. torquens DSM 20004 = KCTC 3535]ATO56563.1 acetolactate synthase small subunit [Loigolactobacillus coryniformis subsp. coryniformis KCTC 3167 = DSM 20001]EJN55202.1 Acet